jgi:hypothetical protein
MYQQIKQETKMEKSGPEGAMLARLGGLNYDFDFVTGARTRPKVKRR